MVVLTDGEDTCSSLTSRDITSELENPPVDNFMFVVVAVEMDRNSEAEFEPWMQHNHCKQLSVGVKTGKRKYQCPKSHQHRKALERSFRKLFCTE